MELFIHGILDPDYRNIRAVFEDERITEKTVTLDNLFIRLRNVECTLIADGTRSQNGRRKAR